MNRDPESLVQRLKYLDPKDRSQLLDALAGSSLPLEPAAKPLSWSQVREMHQGGVEFGGHTVTHPILALESREKQQEEIQRSRDRIQEETGILPTTFAYPNGSRRDYTNETVDVLKQIGFHGACTTVRGSNRPGCDPYRLRRIGIGSDPTWVLEARLSGLFDDSARKLLPKFAFRVGVV